jgi:hypothetical protein
MVHVMRSLRQGIRSAVQRLLLNSTRVSYVPALMPRSSAELRAKRLLLRLLSPDQRKELARRGYFTVQVRNRGSFRILPSTAFNVVDTKSGAHYCAGPEGPVPLADWMLAQKLVLENDPERFFRAAHRRHEE